MLTVPLYGKYADGRPARMDDGDYELVAAYRWRARMPAPGSDILYATAAVREHGRMRHFYMHTLITGWPFVDHADGDGLNCQRYNLRKANKALNAANSGKRTSRNRPPSSPYKGVYLNRRTGKWVASICVDGRVRYLGQYADETDAARAYDAAALEAWGPFARLNFPDAAR